MSEFVFSIDDAGSGPNVDSLRRPCRFFESRGLRAPWFVIPKPVGKPWSTEWRAALIEARDAGHALRYAASRTARSGITSA